MNPVLLIHGLGDTSKLFGKMASHLEVDAREVHCLDLVPNNGDEGLDRQIEAYIEAHFPSGKIDLVGFSMGGVVSQYYLQRLGGIDRVRRFITIASPHRGTLTAFLLRRPGVLQMRPGSAFLKDLNSDCHCLKRVGFTSIWTGFDLMILPASSSRLSAGQSIHIPVIAHPLMVTDKRVLGLVRAILSQPVDS